MNYFRGFLGNGGWLVMAHTKKCGRQRRRVERSMRVRELIPNRQSEFAVAARSRAAVAH